MPNEVLGTREEAGAAAERESRDRTARMLEVDFILRYKVEIAQVDMY